MGEDLSPSLKVCQARLKKGLLLEGGIRAWVSFQEELINHSAVAPPKQQDKETGTTFWSYQPDVALYAAQANLPSPNFLHVSQKASTTSGSSAQTLSLTLLPLPALLVPDHGHENSVNERRG